MMRNGLTRIALVLGAVLAIAASGCGGDDKVTNPNPPPPTPELNSGNFTQGQLFSHVFDTAGTYDYNCTLHASSMTGTVVVDASSSDTVAFVDIPGLSFSPTSVTVAVNGRVAWTNNDTRTHNVVSLP